MFCLPEVKALKIDTGFKALEEIFTNYPIEAPKPKIKKGRFAAGQQQPTRMKWVDDRSYKRVWKDESPKQVEIDYQPERKIVDPVEQFRVDEKYRPDEQLPG